MGKFALLLALGLVSPLAGAALSFETMMESFLTTYDANKDSRISLAEFTQKQQEQGRAPQEINAMFATFDTNQDSQLSREELYQVMKGVRERP